MKLFYVPGNIATMKHPLRRTLVLKEGIDLSGISYQVSKPEASYLMPETSTVQAIRLRRKQEIPL